MSLKNRALRELRSFYHHWNGASMGWYKVVDVLAWLALVDSTREPLSLTGVDPIVESAYCHHRHHLDEHSSDFDTCPHFICVNARRMRQ